MRLVAAIACALMLTCLGAPLGHAEKRVALVIGNAAYQNTPQLANSVNDAEDVAAGLRNVGFAVILERNLSKRGMENALARFARQAQDSDAALVYFAGHGMQYAGNNYLMPVDAKLEDEFSANFELTRMDDVLFSLGRARGVKILVLDACRNNPLADRLSRRAFSRDFAPARGLARIEAGRGMVIAYSTQPNQIAVDGEGRNSPFARALVKQIEVPGLEIDTLFRRVAAEVNRETGGKQLPELSVSLLGEFYLNTRETDLQAWAKVRASNDPDQLESFIRQNPASVLVQDARERLAMLQKDRSDRMQREQAEQAAREVAERERSAREQAAREQAARERLAAEQAEREKAERERLAKSEEERKRREQVDPATTATPPAPKDQIALLTPPSQPAPVTVPSQLSGSALIAEIKKELSRVGCYAGNLDDTWADADTNISVKKFVRYANLPAVPDHPNVDFLDAIRGAPKRVYPLECGPREVAKDGRCIARTCPEGSVLGGDGICRKRKSSPSAAARSPESNQAGGQQQRAAVNSTPSDSGATHGEGCPNGLVATKRRNGSFRCLVPLNSEPLRKEPDVHSLRGGQVVLVDDGSCPKGQMKRVQGPSAYSHIASSYCAPR